MDKVEEKTNLKNNETNENISTFKKVKKVLNYIGKVLSYASIVLLVIIGAFLLYYLKQHIPCSAPILNCPLFIS